MSTKKMVLVQVASIVLLALLSAVTPREYLWIVFLLYLVVIMVITSRSVVKTAKKVSKPKSPMLFEEKNPVLAMSSDIELLNEMKRQSGVLLVSLTIPLILLFMFIPLYWQYIDPGLRQLLENSIQNDLLISFTMYLVFYSTLASISLGLRRLISRYLKMEKQLLIPRRFAVYRDGVLADGRFFEFTSDMCYEVNTKRRFAAIQGQGIPFIIRLYTLEISKLKEALKGGKISECGKAA